MTSEESARSGSYGGIASGASRRGPARTAGPPAGELPPDAAAMRAARRRWASGVAVVTTRDDAGYRGAAVSAFAVVSLDPPLILVCLDREGRMSQLVPAAGVFAVSLLDRSGEFLADRFAGLAPLPDARFTGVAHRLAASGCPVLAAALAWYDCRVHATHDGGDHLIIVGEVTAIGLGEDTDDPLLSYEGRYRGIEGA
jgi:3-hydroxy-9,10-secoandrosta-1,3,5(10)-triene-9,17-dione monooxygenase reductase component